MTLTVHVPVLLDEAIENLNIKEGGTYIDATFGGGGHTKKILSQIGPKGRVLAVDMNPDAEKFAQQLSGKAREDDWGTLIFRQGNFSDLDIIVQLEEISDVDGVLFDLGLSSDLLASDRGLSFRTESNLDMRFGDKDELTAQDIVNFSDEEDLIFMFSNFGEEPFSKRIAHAIIVQREKKKIESTTELKELVERAVPRKKYRIHPATRVFQALRIVVNHEFKNLSQGLEAATSLLATGGRLVVIAFHSLEDRLVKNFFKRMSGQCICFAPPELCRCELKNKLVIITKKPVVPTAKEQKINPRSRSAKMRVAQKN